jgi:hypothetical protein
MKVFISYTRPKDKFDAVTEFQQHFENVLGDSVPGSTVFLDTIAIQAGDRFPEKITHELNEADVLMVLISPAWLDSPWCRKEFDLFSAKQTAQGQRPCILPVLWTKTPDLKTTANDRIARELASFQYHDWHDLRHEEWNNPESKRQITRLTEAAVAPLSEQERIRTEGGATGSAV